MAAPASGRLGRHGPPGRVLYVGNLPFDATEEAVVDVMQQVGPVVAFRLVFSHDGKPKGFGYCEYQDPETARSALRNLNGTEVSGRPIRLDLADSEHGAPPPLSDGMGGGGPLPPPPPPGGPRMQQQPPPTLPSSTVPAPGPGYSTGPPPLGAPPMTAAKASEVIVGDIVSTVQSLSPVQVHELLNQLKMMATQEPEKARQLMFNNPQFTYAIVESLLLLGIIRPDMVTSLLQGGIPNMGPPPPQVMDPMASMGGLLPPHGLMPGPLPPQPQPMPIQRPMDPRARGPPPGPLLPPQGYYGRYGYEGPPGPPGPPVPPPGGLMEPLPPMIDRHMPYGGRGPPPEHYREEGRKRYRDPNEPPPPLRRSRR